MKIEHIYISAYIHDFRLTCCCVASIRYWYPDIPISLLKDESRGTYNTEELERYWDVDIFRSPQRKFGWGWSKLEPLVMERRERCLILDSDTVFVGRVLDVLDLCDEDFVVAEENFWPDSVEENFFSLSKLQELDPAFVYPGYAFNSGQVVATSGILHRDDFFPFVEFSEPPKAKYPQIFRNNDQGLLNYILMKKQQEGQLSIGRRRFMLWKGNDWQIVLRRVRRNSPYPYVIHWAGPKKTLFLMMQKGRILRHFESIYYSRLPHGQLLRAERTLKRVWGVARGKIPTTRYAE